MREVRSAFQQTMRAELVAAMERLTGRKVRAIVGGTELDPDIASQIFVLDGTAVDHEHDNGNSAAGAARR